MSLACLLKQREHIRPSALLALNHLTAAAKRIFDKWPEVVPAVLEKDEEQIVLEMNEKLQSENWKGTSVAKVVRAARVAFSARFRQRHRFDALRDFYLEEIRGNSSRGFVKSMFSVYIATYEPSGVHTTAMSKALKKAGDRLGAQWQQLALQAPEVLDPKNGHQTLGTKIAGMVSIWEELRQIGFSAPHAPGIIDHAHLHYLKTVGNQFSQWAEVERLLQWLKPNSGSTRLAGVSQSIDAMINPWLKKDCPDDFRNSLLERLVSIYGDPRVSPAGYWKEIRKECLEVLLRWLTKADMGFFIDVVNRTQPSHMWPPRRDFWLQLYRQGEIDAAWVAFSPDAAEYARQHLISNRELDVSKRFGKQSARGSYSNTSLLIMKIGRKIVVDGCHSYKTHIFDINDSKAPALFSQAYDCYRIRDSSLRSKSHTSIDSWKDWVMMQVLPGTDLLDLPAPDAATPKSVPMGRPKAPLSSGVSTNARAAAKVRSYVKLLVESVGPEAANPRIQLLERLIDSGAILAAESVEDQKGRRFIVIKCQEGVSIVDAVHYLNTRIVHPNDPFLEKWRAADGPRRATFLTRWNYTVSITQSPLDTFVHRFLDVLKHGLRLKFYRAV
jgi:hypothetical protein